MQVEAPLLPTQFLLEHKVVPRLVEQIAPPVGVDARESSASILITLLQNGNDSDFPDAPTAPLVEQLRRCVCARARAFVCEAQCGWLYRPFRSPTHSSYTNEKSLG
mgnify:CR=1 FL=1